MIKGICFTISKPEIDESIVVRVEVALVAEDLYVGANPAIVFDKIGKNVDLPAPEESREQTGHAKADCKFLEAVVLQDAHG